jgi:dTDP-4-dehydrorhamnose reductase
MNRAKIIGTGLTGLVGSRIVELLSRKYQFIDFSLDKKVDITDFSKLKDSFKDNNEAEAVLHLAAFTDVNRAWEQNGDKNGLCYKVNVLGTKNIATLCQEYNKYLIHISTDFVFDGKSPPKSGYLEEDKPNPIEWYGQTKFMAEQEVEKSGSSYTILRIAFPYKTKSSDGETYLLDGGKKIFKQDLVRKMINRLQKGETLHLFEDQLICPTFIDDIAFTVDKVLQKKPQQERFHCIGSESISPYGIGQKIINLFSLKKGLVVPSSLSEYLKKNPHIRPYQPKLVLNNKKLYNDLGLRLITISEGLKKLKNSL